ncbi:MAG: hypothetical protein H0U42_11215 [Thermoleophilaceae bacterium]|nr:hypothetical protein [Thermoleophilaceae bacterium]
MALVSGVYESIDRTCSGHRRTGAIGRERRADAGEWLVLDPSAGVELTLHKVGVKPTGAFRGKQSNA